MKCYFHEGMDAVATCQECGKYLCKPCSEGITPILCTDCAKERSGGNFKQSVKTLAIKTVMGFVVGLIIAYFMTSSGTGSKSMFWMTVIMFSSVPAGWSLITRLFPFVASGNVMFMLVFYTIKLVASVLLGWAVLLFYIIRVLFYAIKGATDKKAISNISAYREESAAEAAQRLDDK